MKKILIVLVLVSLVATGAFAQLVFGVTGALHMDEKLSSAQIQQRFQDGEGIFYGPFAEIIFGNLGIGLAGNFSFYEGTGLIQPYNVNITGKRMMDYDVTLYLSYHLFGGRSFLDPFGEIGGGVIATTFADSNDQDLIPWDGPLLANGYWYAAIGLGINLGGLGIFGKFSYNHRVDKPVTADMKPTFGTGTQDLPGYGFDSVLFPNGYLPKYRFPLGAKLAI